MESTMSNLHFRFMSLGIRFRDLFMPPRNILEEADIVPGGCVLDYGCGPGSYAIDVAQLVGESGKVYALDIHPLALQSVRNRASKKNFTNVVTILSDCATGLESESIDVVLFYDTLHTLGDPDAVLQELHRVLKPHSSLSFSDHHMEEPDILSKMTEGGLFEFSKKGKKTYTFLKVG